MNMNADLIDTPAPTDRSVVSYCSKKHVTEKRDSVGTLNSPLLLFFFPLNSVNQWTGDLPISITVDHLETYTPSP
jgi:hypothetical protein